MTIITNESTLETKIFNTNNEHECLEMMIFLRKAVIDYVFSNDYCEIKLDNGTIIATDAESPEFLRWGFAGMMFSQCVNSGEWGEIVSIYETENTTVDDENEDEVD